MKAKISISIFVCMAVTVIVNVTRYMIVAKDYPLAHMDAPVRSISSLTGYGHDWSIFVYMIMLALLKLFGAAILGLTICVISSLCRSDAAAIAGAFAVLALPAAAVGADITVVKYFSVFAYTDGNIFLQAAVGEQIWFVILGVGAIAASVFLIRRQWRRGMSV